MFFWDMTLPRNQNWNCTGVS